MQTSLAIVLIKVKEAMVRAGDLTNHKGADRPRKTSRADEGRILSVIWKNLHTAGRQIRNTLHESGVGLSMTTACRRIHERKYRKSCPGKKSCGQIKPRLTPAVRVMVLTSFYRKTVIANIMLKELVKTLKKKKKKTILLAAISIT